MLDSAIILVSILAVSGSITVVSNEVKGIEPCLDQCVGLVNSWWRESKDLVETKVDISICKFKYRPIVLAVIESEFEVRNGGEIFGVTDKEFSYNVYKHGRGDLQEHANKYWKLSWSAVGYAC